MNRSLLTVEVDPSLDVPAYRQLAAHLRFRIARGELKPGAVLPSVREIAELWGVHYNTAWRTYGLLASEGLLVTQPRKQARVASTDTWQCRDFEGFEPFLQSVRIEARRRFGASVDLIVDGLRSLTAKADARAGPVWVVECSLGLAEGLASQVGARWGVDARPWTLDRIADLPDGQIVATLYHLSELQRFARDTGREVRFVPVHVDLEPIERMLQASTDEKARIRLCGVECDGALAIAGEVREALGRDIEIRISVESHPEPVIASINRGEPLLISPQLWDRLGPAQRARDNVIPYRTRIPAADLDELGDSMGWGRV